MPSLGTLTDPTVDDFASENGCFAKCCKTVHKTTSNAFARVFERHAMKASAPEVGEFYCGICARRSTSVNNFRAHCVGKNHRTNLNFCLSAVACVTPEGRFLCRVCGVTTTDQTGFNAHLAGKGHRECVSNVQALYGLPKSGLATVVFDMLAYEEGFKTGLISHCDVCTANYLTDLPHRCCVQAQDQRGDCGNVKEGTPVIVEDFGHTFCPEPTIVHGCRCHLCKMEMPRAELRDHLLLRHPGEIFVLRPYDVDNPYLPSELKELCNGFPTLPEGLRAKFLRGRMYIFDRALYPTFCMCYDIVHDGNEEMRVLRPVPLPLYVGDELKFKSPQGPVAKYLRRIVFGLSRRFGYETKECIQAAAHSTNEFFLASLVGFLGEMHGDYHYDQDVGNLVRTTIHSLYSVYYPMVTFSPNYTYLARDFRDTIIVEDSDGSDFSDGEWYESDDDDVPPLITNVVAQMDRASEEGVADRPQATSDFVACKKPTCVMRYKHNPFEPLDVADISSIVGNFDKELFFTSFQWSTSAAQGEHLCYKFMPGDALIPSANAHYRLAQCYSFFRAGVKIRIQVNGNNFASGALVAALCPPRANEGLPNLRQLTAIPGSVTVQANCSCSVCLDFPWISTHDYYATDQPRRQVDDRILCSLHIAVLNKLSVGTGAESSVSVSVYVSFPGASVRQLCEPHEIALPKAPALLVPRPPSRVLAPLRTQAQFLNFQGILTSFQNLYHIGMRGIEVFVDGVKEGTTLLGFFGLDKPSIASACHASKLTQGEGWTHGVGPDLAQRFSLFPSTGTEVAPHFFGSRQQCTDNQIYPTVLDLMKIPVWVKTIPWKMNDPVGTELFSTSVTPFSDVEDFATALSPTWLQYYAGFYAFWSGSIVYVVQVIGPKVITGRLMLVHAPGKTSSALTLSSASNYNYEVYDAACDNERASLSCGQINDLPYQSCGITRPPDYLASSTGRFYLFVQNPLSMPSNVASSVEINIFICAGEDFRVNQLVGRTSCIGYPPTEAQGMPVNAQGGDGLAKIVDVDQYHFGESQTAFGQILKRTYFWRTVPFTSFSSMNASPEETAGWQLLIPLSHYDCSIPSSAFKQLNTPQQLVAPFAFARGSLRLRIIAEENITMHATFLPDALTHLSDAEQAVHTKRARMCLGNGVVPYRAANNGALEVEVPFHSREHARMGAVFVGQDRNTMSRWGWLTLTVFASERPSGNIAIYFAFGDDYVCSLPAYPPRIVGPPHYVPHVNQTDFRLETALSDTQTPVIAQMMRSFGDACTAISNTPSRLADRAIAAAVPRVLGSMQGDIDAVVQRSLRQACTPENVHEILNSVLEAPCLQKVAHDACVEGTNVLMHILNLVSATSVLQFMYRCLHFIVGTDFGRACLHDISGLFADAIDIIRSVGCHVKVHDGSEPVACVAHFNHDRVVAQAQNDTGLVARFVEYFASLLSIHAFGHKIALSVDAIKEFCKRVVAVGRFATAIRAISSFIPWLCEVGRELLASFPSLVLACSGDAFAKRVRSFVAEVERVTGGVELATVSVTAKIVDSVCLLRDERLELQDLILSDSRLMRYNMLLARHFKKIDDYYKIVIAQGCAKPYRFDPFCISFVGKSGVGKSACGNQLARDLGAIFGWPKCNLMYAVSGADEYWSGYTAQKIVIVDDIGATKDDPMVAQLITMKSNVAMPLNMAALEEKGRLFTSELVITTANDFYPRPVNLTHNEAFLRRRNLLVEVTFSDRLMFTIHDPLTNTVQPGRPMEYSAFLELAARNFANYSQLQTQLVNSYSTCSPCVAQVMQNLKDVVVPSRLLHRDYFALDGNGVCFSDVAPEWVRVEYDECKTLADIENSEFDLSVWLRENMMRFVDGLDYAALRATLRAPVTVELRGMSNEVCKGVRERVAGVQRTLHDFTSDHWVACVALCGTIIGFAGIVVTWLLTRETDLNRQLKAHGLVVSDGVVAQSDHFADTRSARIVPVRTVQAQFDQRFSHTAGLCAQSLRRVSIRGGLGWALAIVGRTYAIPAHYLHRHGYYGEDISIEVGTGRVSQWFTFTTTPENLHVADDGRDLCLFEVPGMQVPAARNFVNHFVTDYDLTRLARFDAALVTYDEMKFCTAIRHGEISHEDSTVWGHCFTYDVDTVAGDCGLPLLQSGTAVAPKIVGFHTAGLPGAGVGFATIITQDILRRLLFPSRVGPARVVGPDNTLLERVQPQFCMGESNFTVFGKVPGDVRPGFADTTSFRPSIIHGVFPPTSRPPLTRSEEEKLELQGIFFRGVERMGQFLEPAPESDLNVATKFVTDYLVHNMKPLCTSYPLTWNEAAFGNALPYYDRVNMASSPGYPYCLKHKDGKHFFLEDDQIRPELLETLNENEKLARRGERAESWWIDCKKDQRLPVVKVMAGKVRVFTIGNLHAHLLARKYLLHFVAAFHNAHLKIFSAVGIDVHSVEWTLLWNRLFSVSDVGFDVDFRNFDGSAGAVYLQAICSIIISWFRAHFADFDDDDAMTVWVIFDEICHTYAIARGFAYMQHQGNPSGCFLTTIINTILHFIVLFIAWRILAREHQPEYATSDCFLKLVALFIYGDDGIVSTRVPWFNRVTVCGALAKFSFVLTSSRKDGVLHPFDSLYDCTFLKQMPVRDLRYAMFIHPCMNLDTIHELANWVRLSPDAVEACELNVRDACRFAYHYGPEFYNAFRTAICNAWPGGGR